MWKLVATIALLITFVSAAQTTEPTPQSIRGIVTDLSGKPIAGADVVCYDGASHASDMLRDSHPLGRATSGADGRYAFQLLQRKHDSGAFTVLATRPGQCWDSVICSFDYTTHELQTIDARYGHALGDEGVWLVLSPATTLRGKVVDEDGRPVAGAKVYDGIPRNGPAETNAAGEFALEQVPLASDNYHHYGTLRVEHPDFVNDMFSEAYGRRENIELRLRRGALVSGRVTLEDGKPLEGIWVQRQEDANGLRDWQAKTDGEGKFSMRVPAGFVQLSVRQPKTLLCLTPPVEFNAQAGEQTGDRNFTCRRVEVPLGRVAYLDRLHSSGNTRVRIERIKANELRESVADEIAITENDAFEVPRLDRGTYVASLFNVAQPDHALVESRFEITDFDKFEGVYLLLRDPTFPKIEIKPLLNGRVVDADGHPAPLADVQVFDFDFAQEVEPPGGPVGRGMSRLDGAFKVDSAVRSHHVLICAWSADGEFAGTFDGTLGEQPIEIRLTEKTSEITGTIRDEAGHPVGGRPVVLGCGQRTDRIPGYVRGTVTDEQGHYAIRGYFGSPLHLSLRPDFGPAEQVSHSRSGPTKRLKWESMYLRFPVKPGETLDKMDFVIEPGEEPWLNANVAKGEREALAKP